MIDAAELSRLREIANEVLSGKGNALNEAIYRIETKPPTVISIISGHRRARSIFSNPRPHRQRTWGVR